MKRILAVLGLVGALGMVFGTVPAGAGGPTNEVTLMLSCDKDVTATVSVDFVVNAGGGVSMTCDSKRAVVTLPQPETAIVVTFDVSTNPVGCAATPQQVSLPARIDCGSKAGAKLTAR